MQVQKQLPGCLAASKSIFQTFKSLLALGHQSFAHENILVILFINSFVNGSDDQSHLNGHADRGAFVHTIKVMVWHHVFS